MTEETEPLEPVETQPPPEERRKKEGVLGLIDRISGGKGGKIDPLTMILLMDQLRAMRRDEEKWELERNERKNKQNSPPQQLDVKALLQEQNKEWESRFEKQQDRMERMFLGKKLEDTEERAKVAEEKLKEKEEKEEQEKLVEEKIGPLEEELGVLRIALAQKTAGMTNEQKKGVFDNIGKNIEEAIGGEVGNRISNTITNALAEAFTPPEEGIATTKEGKVDYAKETFKSINKGLTLVGKYIDKMPAGPPEVKEVKKMPEVEKPPLTPEQQRILDKVKRGEELAPPPGPPAPAEVKEEEKAPPPKKPPEKPKEEKPPEEKKPPPTEEPKEEKKAPIKPKEEGVPPLGPPLPEKFEPNPPPKTEEKPIVKEPPRPVVEEKVKAEPKPKPKLMAKPKPKEKPKEEPKPIPKKEKRKVAEKTKEKPKRPKTRRRSETTEKSVDKQTS